MILQLLLCHLFNILGANNPPQRKQGNFNLGFPLLLLDILILVSLEKVLPLFGLCFPIRAIDCFKQVSFDDFLPLFHAALPRLFSSICSAFSEP